MYIKTTTELFAQMEKDLAHGGKPSHYVREFFGSVVFESFNLNGINDFYITKGFDSDDNYLGFLLYFSGRKILHIFEDDSVPNRLSLKLGPSWDFYGSVEKLLSYVYKGDFNYLFEVSLELLKIKKVPRLLNMKAIPGFIYYLDLSIGPLSVFPTTCFYTREEAENFLYKYVNDRVESLLDFQRNSTDYLKAKSRLNPHPSTFDPIQPHKHRIIDF